MFRSATLTDVGLRLSARVMAASILFMLGGVMVYGVGLSHSTAAHNAAHDTRHTLGFPCH
jgi:cobalt transporter subunit CbtB